MPNRIILQTARLCLRPFELADAEEFYLLNADAEVMRYVPDDPFPDVDAAREFLKNYLPVYETGYGRLAMIRQADGAYIGWCGLKYHPETDEVDLGYRLHRRYWGQGYATEAGLACIQHGFVDKKLRRVMAHAAVDNIGSRRVLEKVGMVYAGEFEEPDWSGVLYEIIANA